MPSTKVEVHPDHAGEPQAPSTTKLQRLLRLSDQLHPLEAWKRVQAALPRATMPGPHQRLLEVMRLLAAKGQELEDPRMKPRPAKQPRTVADLFPPEYPLETVAFIDRMHAGALGARSNLPAARALVQAIVRNAERSTKRGYIPDYSEFTRTWTEYCPATVACGRAVQAWAALWREGPGGRRVDVWGPTLKALEVSGLGIRCRNTLKRECRGWLERPDTRPRGTAPARRTRASVA